MFMRRRLVAGIAAAGVVGLNAVGQGLGSYLNFETPQLKPVACTTAGSGGGLASFLLVCNSPDNSVEIYNTANNAFLGRVPVGLEPATVVAKPTLLTGDVRRCYTAN